MFVVDQYLLYLYPCFIFAMWHYSVPLGECIQKKSNTPGTFKGIDPEKQEQKVDFKKNAHYNKLSMWTIPGKRKMGKSAKNDRNWSYPDCERQFLISDRYSDCK